MYWDSYIIRSFYNNEGNVIFSICTGTATSSDLSIIMGEMSYSIKVLGQLHHQIFLHIFNMTFPTIIIEKSDDVAVPVHIFNITFPPIIIERSDDVADQVHIFNITFPPIIIERSDDVADPVHIYI
jgi:hypothetical protein